MAGPLTPRPGPDSSPEDQRRYWVDVALTASLRARAITWPALLAAIVAAHLAVTWRMIGNGKGPILALVGSRGPKLLVAVGALTDHAIFDGASWRLITGLFLHGDGLHLLLNGLALMGLGSLCEAVFGPARLLALFVICGVAGGLCSSLGGVEVSVGASGALFGWMGAALSFGWRYGAVLPHDVSALLRRQLLPWAALNVGVGFLLPFLDWRAHLGGLFAGLILGATLGNRVVPGAESARGWRIAAALCSLAVIALALAGLARSAGMR